jgi:hypothetical protein
MRLALRFAQYVRKKADVPMKDFSTGVTGR